MDERDRKIIRELLKDGRAKINKIAEKTGIPVTTVHKRIKKLVEEGILEIKARINKRKAGYGICAYILVKIDTSSRSIDQERVAEKMASIKGVEEVSVVTGRIDIVAKVHARDIDELSDIVLKRLRSMEGVAGTETLVVLKSKEGREEKFIL